VPLAKNGNHPDRSVVNRSRIALFLASAGLVAVSGGCGVVPSGGGGESPQEMRKPAVAPPPVSAPAQSDGDKHGAKNGKESGEGGEGGEG
jgi:hypothetical protein